MELIALAEPEQYGGLAEGWHLEVLCPSPRQMCGLKIQMALVWICSCIVFSTVRIHSVRDACSLISSFN